MNFIEACIAASDRKERILNEERGEWIIYSSGAFRYASNRQDVSFSLRDYVSDAWLSERDFIVTHRGKVVAGLDKFLDNINEPDNHDTNVSTFIDDIRISAEREKYILGLNGIVTGEKEA